MQFAPLSHSGPSTQLSVCLSWSLSAWPTAGVGLVSLAYSCGVGFDYLSDSCEFLSRKQRDGRADSLLRFWGPGCMCVERAACTSVCPRDSPTWSFLSLAASILVARSLSKKGLGSSFGTIWIGNLRTLGIPECVLEVPSES